eukprot:TRINITY_DN7_c0_g1_i2.p1 TRINITY_DN7_c0_g1~~TRINITY_DN7_c0_g1_i2.p1  ORF type:complete len:126 (-),score=37.12 TRINITY_DN7_c0_g1_i2:57-434(-)
MARNYAAETDDRERALNNALNSRNFGGVIEAVSANPPFGCDDDALKRRNLDNVVRTLVAFKESDIASALKGCPPEYLDVLMKYIYAGLEDGQNSSTLLKWHKLAVEESGGLGPIVRTIATHDSVL